MSSLPFILICFFIISLILNYLTLSSTKSAMELVKEMGIGYNLGNLFDCHNNSYEILNPNDQLTLCGYDMPTKSMFTSIKKYGFKTIRFPVTWINIIDNNGNINPVWISRIKETINNIIDSNLYCILNVHDDGLIGNWLNEGLNVKNKYINLWRQISNEFKNYDENLIFESMKEIEYRTGEFTDYIQVIFNFTQAFVDTVRNSGGNNINRLLIISGIRMNIDFTCSSDYKMPIDPSNKLAISIIYYYPSDFTLVYDDKPSVYDFGEGEIYVLNSLTNWGNDNDYIEIVTNFEMMKKAFIDKGIPVIITECGVITEQKKNITSIREYLYTVFSMSIDYEYISPCLWDTSLKNDGDTNYYNREKNEWYDEKIKKMFKTISKRRNIKPFDYYYNTTYLTKITPITDGNFYIKIEKKAVSKVIFNANIPFSFISDFACGIISVDEKGEWIFVLVEGKEGKREYDGSYSFNIDVKNKNFNDFIYLVNISGNNLTSFNNLTIQFQESFLSFNYTGYKIDISDFIS